MTLLIEMVVTGIGHSEDDEKYTNKYHPDYIPGTLNVLMEEKGVDLTEARHTTLKVTKDGVVLHPQPSDSPNDPLNWSNATKYYQFAILLFITAFTAATTNDSGAAQDSLNEEYGISYDSFNTGAGILFVAIGLSTYILGPSASLYGRKPTYIICILMGLIGAIWFGYTKTTSDAMWSQLFVGASEGCAEAVLQQSITDMFFQHQHPWTLTLYILATSVGTYLGPLIAGFINEYTTYNWVGWTAAVISGGLLLVMFTSQYETAFDRTLYWGHKDATTPYQSRDLPYEITVLDDGEEKDKAMKLIATPSNMWGTGANEEPKPYLDRIRPYTPSTSLQGSGFKQYFRLGRLMLRVFWFPPVLLSGLLWGMQDALLSFYLTTEDNQYYYAPWNYSDTGVALMNVPCTIGSIIGCFYAGIFSDYVVKWIAKRRGGIMEAEDYLWMLTSILIIDPIGLMVFAVGTDKVWSWKITYTVGLGFIGFGWGCAGDIAMSYLMTAYPEMVLEGMIGVALINNMIGCIFTFACSPWLDAMGNTNTYAVLTALQILSCLLMIPFMKYGKGMRRWTKKYYISYIEARDGLRKK